MTDIPNQPQPTTPITPAVPVVPVTDNHLVPASPKIKNPGSMFKDLLNGPNGKLIKFGLVFLGGFTILILILGVLKFVFKQNIALPLGILPTPPAQTFAPVATSTPSKYASEPAVIKIDEDINKLDEDLGRVELDESNIRPRPLDFDVVFK